MTGGAVSIQTGNLTIDEMYGKETYYSFDLTEFIRNNYGTSGIKRQKLLMFPPPGCSGCRSLALTSRLAPQGKPIPFETGRVLFKAKTFGRGGHGEGRDSLSSERFSLPSPRSF